MLLISCTIFGVSKWAVARYSCRGPRGDWLFVLRFSAGLRARECRGAGAQQMGDLVEVGG